MKKIKKLMLNKEVVSNLNKVEMNHLQGGLTFTFTFDLPCLTASLDPWCHPPKDTNPGGQCYTSDYEFDTCEVCH